MRRALVLVALAACGKPAAPPADPIGNDAPPLIERDAEAPDAPRRAKAARKAPAIKPGPEWLVPSADVLDQQIAILRELVVDATGLELLELKARLYRTLDVHPDQVRKAEALMVAAGLTQSADFATFRSADEILFEYGVSLRRAGHDDEARVMWLRLVKDFPRSELVPDVYLGFGDAAFDAADLANAEAFYQKTLQFPKARARDYARYKLAWVHYNLARFEDALAGFVDVAQHAPEPLSRAAGKDAVRAYAEVGDPAKALDFFQRVDRARAGELVLMLAELYSDLGKIDAAAVAYRAAVPALDEDGACRAELGILSNQLMVAQSHAVVLEALERLAAGPRPGDCGERAAELVMNLAYGWNLEHLKLKSDPADAIAAWRLAEELATGDEDRLAAAKARAELHWQRAAFAGDAESWADTAEVFHRAAGYGEPSLDGIAIDAWTNALRMSASIGDRARVELRAIAGRPGAFRGRAQALLDQIR